MYLNCISSDIFVVLRFGERKWKIVKNGSSISNQTWKNSDFVKISKLKQRIGEISRSEFIINIYYLYYYCGTEDVSKFVYVGREMVKHAFSVYLRTDCRRRLLRRTRTVDR